MSSYKIFSESTADLSLELVQKTGIIILPVPFQMEGKEYKNTPVSVEMGNEDFYSKMREGIMPTTAQLNSEEFIDYAKPVLEEGFDILHIAFSSALSGTYNSCRLAAEELKEEFPDRKIIIVDTLCASMGEGLMVYLAAQKQQQGASIEEVAGYIEGNKQRLNQWFTVDDLNHLYRGGRVTKMTAVAGSVLGIKPIMRVNAEGKLVPADKVRGRKKSLDALVQKAMERATDPQEQVVFISHGDCAEECEYVANEIKAKLNVKDVFMNYIGPSIGAHSGPGTIALFFLGENREV